MAKQYRNPQYWLQRKAKRKTGLPLATIAYYGPDNTRASRVAVGIFLTEPDGPPDHLERWWSDTTDVRTDHDILQKMMAYLDSHEVQRVAMIESIIGCPHEEGHDYPKGETCPDCPYWANRDRWSGELLQ